MASFPPVTMTTEGLNMIAKASSGNTEDRLIITKVKLGDGVSEGNIRDYTDVINSKKEVTLSEWEDRGDGRFRYTFIYNNEGVKTGFYHREIGLFAKNGDSGTEKLIAYSNAGSYPSYIDDETKEIPYQRLMINIGVGDTDNVSGEVDVSNAVTIEMLNEHDADENAHDNLIKRLFGSASATMESVKQKIEDWAKKVCLPLSGGALTGSLGVQDVLMVQKKGEEQPKLAIDDGKHRVDFIIDINGEARFLNENQELVSLYVKDLHGTADKAISDKNGREIDTGYLKTNGGTLTGSLGVQDVLMVQKQTAQPKINLSDGTHTLNIILDENGDVRFLDNNGRTLNIFVKQVIQG